MQDSIAVPSPRRAMNNADAIVLEQLRARDQTAMRQLFVQYYAAMLGMARKFVRSVEEAEEVIQDTWVAVLTGLHRFNGQSSFKTWMFRILENRARSRARREARSIPFSQVAPAQQFEAVAPGSADAAVQEAEARAVVQAAIGRLPPRQQQIVIMSDIEGRSVEEICSALQLSYSNERVLLHRARAKLRELLAPRAAELMFT